MTESSKSESESTETKKATAAEPEQHTENGGFKVGGAGESGSDAGLADIPKADGLKTVETDTDPVLDSEADYNEPEIEFHEDTNRIKSRREEEDEQHARREEANARIEEIAAQAPRTPY